MDVDLKLFKVEYISNHILDHTEILNLSLDEQTQKLLCKQVLCLLKSSILSPFVLCKKLFASLCALRK